jgi:hypothetical protein
MDVLVHGLVKLAADEKIDGRLVVDALRQDPAALRSDLALTTDRNSVAKPEVATNLYRNNKAGRDLVLTIAVYTATAIAFEDFPLPLFLAGNLGCGACGSTFDHAPLSYLQKDTPSTTAGDIYFCVDPLR